MRPANANEGARRAAAAGAAGAILLQQPAAARARGRHAGEAPPGVGAPDPRCARASNGQGARSSALAARAARGLIPTLSASMSAARPVALRTYMDAAARIARAQGVARADRAARSHDSDGDGNQGELLVAHSHRAASTSLSSVATTTAEVAGEPPQATIFVATDDAHLEEELQPYRERGWRFLQDESEYRVPQGPVLMGQVDEICRNFAAVPQLFATFQRLRADDNFAKLFLSDSDGLQLNRCAHQLAIPPRVRARGPACIRSALPRQKGQPPCVRVARWSASYEQLQLSRSFEPRQLRAMSRLGREA
eukprot:scaffold182_cov350-Prasinococcus_capsulatus_cf.AAC.25